MRWIFEFMVFIKLSQNNSSREIENDKSFTSFPNSDFW